MPKFTKIDPRDVAIERSRAAADARKPYSEALQGDAAGKIELERGEKPSTVRRRLTVASKEAGIRIRSTWEDGGQRVLIWKKVGR